MTLKETTVDAGDIADALGLTKSVFMRKVTVLVEHEGMPERLPGRRRWSRIAIEVWLRSYGAKKTDAIVAERTARSIDTDRANLHAAYCQTGPRLVVDNTGVSA